MITLKKKNNKKLLPIVINHLHLHSIPPRLCSPTSFPSLFLHLHPLFLLFCSSRALLALHRPEQHRACAYFLEPPAPRPGLARCGAGHGRVLWGGREGAGLQGSQRAAV